MSEDNQELGSWKASSGAVGIALNRELTKDDNIRAVVRKGELEEESEYVDVQELSLPLPAPDTELVLYVGAECIFAWGAIPDALMEVRNVGEPKPLGSIRATYNGQAFIRLNRPLKGDDKIYLQYKIHGEESEKSLEIIPVAWSCGYPYEEELPAPVVRHPINSCNTEVVLGALVAGAYHKISAGWESTERISFLPSMLDYLGFELQQGWSITGEQYFKTPSYLKSKVGDSVLVDPPEKPPMPVIFEPVYAENTSIFVYNLLPSAEVEVSYQGDLWESGFGEAEIDLGIELEEESTIRVRQFHCNRWSDYAEADVQPGPETLDPPTLEDTHYAGAHIVRVAEKLPGSRIILFSDGRYLDEGKSTRIEVWRALVAEEELTAIQVVGSKTSENSNEVIVKDPPYDQLPVPKIAGYRDLSDKIHYAEPYVEVHNLFPGAYVAILWDDVQIGFDEATGEKAHIYLDIQPWPGAKIRARQKIGKKVSAHSDTVTAVGTLALKTVGDNNRLKYGQAYELTVETLYPVPENITVKLKALVTQKLKNDNHMGHWASLDVLKLLNTEVVIHKGAKDASFQIGAEKLGMIWLKVEAEHFVHFHKVKSLGAQVWKSVGAANGTRIKVIGNPPKVDPVDINVFTGETFTTTLSFYPEPWEWFEIEFEEFGGLSNSLANNSKFHTINPPQSDVALKINTKKTGQAQGKVKITTDFYEKAEFNLTVKSQSQPPIPPGQTYQDIFLHRAAPGSIWYSSEKISIEPGTITKIKNLSDYIFMLVRLPHISEKINEYDELDVEIETDDMFNNWTAMYWPYGTKDLPPSFKIRLYYKK